MTAGLKSFNNTPDGVQINKRLTTLEKYGSYETITALKEATIRKDLPYFLLTENGRIEYNYIEGDFTGLIDNNFFVETRTIPSNIGCLVRATIKNLFWKPIASTSPFLTQNEKNEQTVDLYEALTPAMRASVRGAGGVDIGPCLNAIMRFASGGENQSNNSGGTTLYIKGGRYYTSVPFNNTMRYDRSIIDDGDLRRMNIRGDGSNNTSIFYNGPADTPAYYLRGFRGTTVNDGVEMRHVIEGLRFRRNPINQKTGIGVRIQHATHVMMRDVVVDGFDLGVSLIDTIAFSAEELQVLTSNVGIRANLGDFTNPNVMRFIGGGISGASEIGMHVVRPANLKIDGMRFEANGNNPDTSYTILLELGTPEGGASAIIENCYFENNQGNSDVQLAHGHPYNAMVKVNMNTFHRAGNTRIVKHHIDAAITGAAASANVTMTIEHGPQQYRNLGDYVSSPDRPAVRIQTPGIILVENPGNIYPSDNERPQTNNFTMVGHIYPILSVSVNADGTYNSDRLNQVNVKNITRQSAGRYVVNLFNKIKNITNTNLSASAQGVGCFANVVERDIQGMFVIVEVRNTAGELVNTPFSVTGLGMFA